MEDYSELEIQELKRFQRKAMQALKIAHYVMDYCQGDAWERECTEVDRALFNTLYEELKNESNQN